MSLEPGTLVGRYRVTRLIAQGGMAEVYRAEQELTGSILRPAALKVIRPEYSESPDFREMFLDEARLACTLSHPNIVHIYEVGETDGRLFMAMELVPGESLAFVSRQLREKGERFSNDALIAVGLFTCSALEAVHALRLPGEGHVNLVHRDVSPHNLLLGPTGSLKLIDFGIAKAASNRNLTSPGVTKGKAGYFSPEQAMGKPLDGRSDLFSLGVTLYKLAWGGTPFDDYRTHHERNTALVHGRWKPLGEVCPGLPDGLYDIVERAMKVRPGERFDDAAQMRMALERLAVESGFHVGPSTLAGYVEVQEEDRLALGARPLPSSARHNRPAAVTAQAQATRASGSAPNAPRRTEHLQRKPALSATTHAQLSRTRRRLYFVSGTAVVLLATVLGLIVGQRAARPDEDPLPPHPPEALADNAAAPAAAEPDVAIEPEVEPEVEPADEQTVAAVAEEVAREPKRTVRTPRRDQKREQKREQKERSPVVAASQKEVQKTRTSARIGDGRLRIGGDDGMVEVNGRKWGLSPLDRKVPAGSYNVVVKSLDGKLRLQQAVEVRADRTALVRVDFGTNAITVSGN